MSLYDAMAEAAKLSGRVWCRKCGAMRKVDPAKCLANGWPKCCGETMTIDHPNTWSSPSKEE